MSHQRKSTKSVSRLLILLDTVHSFSVCIYSATFYEVKSCGLTLQLLLTELHLTASAGAKMSCFNLSNTFARSATLICRKLFSIDPALFLQLEDRHSRSRRMYVLEYLLHFSNVSFKGNPLKVDPVMVVYVLERWNGIV